MTARDRLVVMIVALVALLGAGWIVVVSPERKEAAKLQGEIATASTQLASAESQLSNARAAEARYASEYAAVVQLGKAVPPGREVPSLMYELAQASDKKHVDLASIVYGAGAGASPTATGAAGSAVAGFTQMPFTFVFNGSYDDHYSLFQQLDRFTMRTASGALAVSGRLLTIQSVKLEPVVSGSESGAKSSGAQQLSGTVSATAYVLPASQGLTGGATAGVPAGSTAASSAGSGATSPTAPAIVRVSP
jgi:Tfp pilus assembly protein PilO